MFEKFEAVFFDIDGTLVDVFPAHVQSYRNAFKRITGIDVQDPDFFPRLYPLGSDRSVWKTALQYYALEPSEGIILRLQDGREREMARLLKSASEKNVLPGVLEILQKLKKEGKKLFVFSGNTRANGEAILYRTKLAPFFQQGFYSSDSPSIVDKESLFRFATEKTGVPPSRAMVVADTPNDIRAAQKTGMRSVAVATGFHSIQELRKIGYGEVVKNLQETASCPEKK